MKDKTFLFGVLTGVAIVLAVAVVISVNQTRPVYAEGGVGHAGSVTAVTATFGANQDMLYVIDSDEEVVMAYAIAGPYQRGRNQTKMELLAVRSYKWDKKAEYYNGIGKSVTDIKEQVLRREEEPDGGGRRR